MGGLAVILHRLGDAHAVAPIVTDAAAAAGVDPALVLAVIDVESGFNPNARGDDGQSWGLMQVTLATAKVLAGRAVSASELQDPVTNVALGSQYLGEQLARYGNIPDAVAAYNAGTARKNAAGQYVNSQGIPTVQRYVDAVLAAYPRYQGAALVSSPDVQTSATAAVNGGAAAWWTNPWAWGAGAVAAALVLLLVTD